MLSYTGQLDRHLMNARKSSSASESLVVNLGLNVGLEQVSSSTRHYLLMMTTTGKALDIVSNAGEGEGLGA